MNCGRSSSVEWKLPKLQRRVRFPSPAPPPPGYAPGGFVMPPRQARLASHALFYLPLAPLTQPYGRAPGTKLPQHAALAGRTGTKLSQLAALAGRTGTKLSPHPQNGPFQHVLRQQGELYTAPTTNRSSREKKVPHQHPTSPTNAPLPQFRMQFYCMNFQQSPETLQSQRHEFKI